jgi:hypothetical protein
MARGPARPALALARGQHAQAAWHDSEVERQPAARPAWQSMWLAVVALAEQPTCCQQEVLGHGRPALAR